MVTVTRINQKSPSIVGRRHGCAEPTGTPEVGGQDGRFIG